MGKTSKNSAALLITALRNQSLRNVESILDSGTLCLSEWVEDLDVTPLHLAVGSGTEGFAACVVHDMLRCGADSNAVSADGLTPVHVAVAWQRPTVLHLLLLHGGDPWKLDEDGRNAFDYAFETKAWGIVELLHNLQFTPTSLLPRCCSACPSQVITTDELNESTVSVSSKSDQSSQTSDDYFTNIQNLTYSVEKHLDIEVENNSEIINTQVLCNNRDIKSLRADNNFEKSQPCPTTPTISTIQTSPRSPKCLDATELFAELKAAVQRRYLRISGIETIPSSSFCDTAISDAETSKSSLTICVDRNKAIASVSELSNKAELTHETIKNLENDLTCGKPVIKSDMKSSCGGTNILLNHVEGAAAVQGEVEIDDGYCIKHLNLSTSFLSLSDTSSSSSTGFQSCESPPDQSRLKDDTEDIRTELVSYGVNPGPITDSTRGVYIRLLGRIRQQGDTRSSPTQLTQSPAAGYTSPTAFHFPSGYSSELEKALNGNFSSEQYALYEKELTCEFDGSSRTRTCFNYLLLDQRVTQNLPQRSRSGSLSQIDVARQFVAAVFYVGKGQASRPLEHLKEAKTSWQNSSEGKNPKEAKILDIWRSGQGVICLRAFQDISNDEALTREAAMIEAMRRQNLCNLQPGNFYRAIANWPPDKKKKLGVYLLFTAKDIFLQTNERSFRPTDL